MAEPQLPEGFWELHRGLPQQGPGSDASTLRALRLLSGLPAEPRILDIGCGPGRQSLLLARESGGTVTAVDNHRPFLEELEGRAREAGLAGRIRCLPASMDDLPLEPAGFDLVWSEGAAYIMGFEKALSSWKRHLKPGGFLAVSEACWLEPHPPAELEAFWKEGYPAMTDLEGNSALLRKCGYRELGCFPLPVSDWWAYYRPIEARLPELEKRYAEDAAALGALADERFEIEMYRRFSDWYGYGFFAAEALGTP